MAGFADIARGVTEAFREALTDPATWRALGQGDGVAGVPVLLDQPDATAAFGEGRAVVATVIIGVFKVDVAEPRARDTFQLEAVAGTPDPAGRLFKVIGAPTLDGEGELWRCEATEIPVA